MVQRGQRAQAKTYRRTSEIVSLFLRYVTYNTFILHKSRLCDFPSHLCYITQPEVPNFGPKLSQMMLVCLITLHS